MVSRGVIVSKSTMRDFFTTSMSQDDKVNVNEFKKMAKQQGQYTASRDQEDIVRKYKVRVPLIHGISGDASSVPDDQLPEATYCPLPGSQETDLQVGDIVYVCIVDFKFDDLVIIGLVPNSQRISQSGISLKRVQYLKMDEKAPLYVKNLRISFDKGGDVTSKNLQSLQGFEHKLTEYVWPMENGGTGINAATSDDSTKKKFRDNFGVYSVQIMSSQEFEDIQKSNRYESNTIYYIYEGEEETDNKKADTNKEKTVYRGIAGGNYNVEK